MPHSNRLPPPPPSNAKPLAKASHSGRKTTTLATAAGVALMAIPVDPTGVVILTFMGAGTGAMVGFAYHGIVGVVLSDPHTTKMLLQPGRVDLQTELESCIRRLAGSVTGVVVTGTMTLLLPTFLFGVALNEAQLITQAHHLHKLITMAEAAGGVDRYLSSTDITFQVMSGILIKFAIQVCTLGTDVDVAINGAAQLLVGAEVSLDPAAIPETWAEAGHISELYNRLIGDGFVHLAGEVAGEPANFTAGLLGYPELPTWGSGASAGAVTAIGTPSVLVDLATGKLVEDPTNKVLDFASRLGRRAGWRRAKQS